MKAEAMTASEAVAYVKEAATRLKKVGVLSGQLYPHGLSMEVRLTMPCGAYLSASASGSVRSSDGHVINKLHVCLSDIERQLNG